MSGVSMFGLDIFNKSVIIPAFYVSNPKDCFYTLFIVFCFGHWCRFEWI